MVLSHWIFLTRFLLRQHHQVYYKNNILFCHVDSQGGVLWIIINCMTIHFTYDSPYT
ncbi:hypothetical protein Hanom_Chr09g00784461 [Helianthus anomalus]